MTLEIDISVQAARLILSENGGNVRVKPGTELVFKTRDPKRRFMLEFFTLQIGGCDSPFKCGATNVEISVEKPFRTTIGERPAGDVGAFKYSVSTGSLILDPIIVMGDE